MQSSVWNSEELAVFRNSDRILPSQPFFLKMYNGSNFHEDLQKILFSVHGGEEKFDIRLKSGMTYAALGSEINTLRFYQFLIRQGGYKNVLELGTYIGVSAMYLADAVGRNGYVTTVEKGLEFYNIARGNIERNGFIPVLADPWIKQIHMDAKDYLNRTQEKFDFILIDAAKEIYKELLELSINRISDEGLILVDDIFFQGDTLNNEPTSEKGRGVKKCLEYVSFLEGWEKVVLPIGNGLLMMRKCR